VSPKIVRIGDVLELERIPVDVDLDATYDQIGIRSFGNGIFHREPCTGNDLSKLRYFEVRPGRLVVSNIMAWEGAVGVSTDAEKGSVGSARFLSYRAVGDADIRYLNYFFQTEEGRSMIRSASTGTVARNQTLSPGSFERISLLMPDLGEQKRIADTLEMAIGRLARLSILRRRATRIVEGFMEALLGDSSKRVDLSHRDREGQSRSAVTAARRAGMHSLGSTTYRVGDVIELIRRPVDVIPGEVYREIGLRSFGKGVFHKPSVSGEELGSKKVFYIAPGDLLFSSVFAWEGAVALASERELGLIGSHRFMTYRVDAQKADSRYLRYYFSAGPGLQAIRDASPGSAGRNRTLGIKTFDRQVISLPELDEQRRIARQLTLVRRTVDAGADQTSQVTVLRSALLNAAFSGWL
jgi:type I restriction enzyme, S subunit